MEIYSMSLGGTKKKEKIDLMSHLLGERTENRWTWMSPHQPARWDIPA